MNRLIERKPRKTLHAVDGVGFIIQRGQTLALADESGCGKSTIAKLVSGLHAPSGGKIVGEGTNRSVMNHEPTLNGETEAIHDACRTLETVDLCGCTLYSSCEPCAL